MSQGTHTPAAGLATTRPQWRDGIKASGLTPTTRLVALLMADYWPKDGAASVLWCAVDTLREQSGLSRATVYRALTELQEWGWLVQVAGHSQHRSPRYLARVGAQRSHPETPEVAQRDSEISGRDSKPQDSSTDSTRGSEDQDSRRGPQQAANRPYTAAEIRDYNILAKHMSNYPAEAVTLVWTSLHAGTADGTQADKPGHLAQTMHRRKSKTMPGVSEWQGLFSRLFRNQHGEPAMYPLHDAARKTIRAA